MLSTVKQARGARAGSEGAIEIFRAGSQLIKVRAIMWLSVACALAACWFGWEMFRSYGLRPADGGVLAPLGVRLAWGLGLAGLGLAFVGGMWLYGRCYVARLTFDPRSGRAEARTVGFFAGRWVAFGEADVLGSSYYGGQAMSSSGVSVKAPWYTVRLRGRRWPLVLDAQGQFSDERLATRLMRAG